MIGILLPLANRLPSEAVDIVSIGILLPVANRLPSEAVDIVSIGILLPVARKLGLKQDVCCVESFMFRITFSYSYHHDIRNLDSIIAMPLMSFLFQNHFSLVWY